MYGFGIFIVICIWGNMSDVVQLEFAVKIENSLGIHARPASMIVQLASKFNSEIIIKKEDDEVDAKSLMSVLMLSAGHGTELLFFVEGDDAHDAHSAFVDLIVTRKFDEK